MKILCIVVLSAAFVLSVSFINVEGKNKMDPIGKVRALDSDLQKEGVRELLQ